MNRLLFAVIGSVVAASCGDSTGVSYPDVRGGYDASYRIIEKNLTTSQEADLQCTGTLSIATQTGGSFSGTFTIVKSSSCDWSLPAGEFTGEVESDGTITLRLTENGSGLFEAPACTVTSGDDVLRGTFTDNRISVAGAEALRCTSGPTTENMALQVFVAAAKR